MVREGRNVSGQEVSVFTTTGSLDVIIKHGRQPVSAFVQVWVITSQSGGSPTRLTVQATLETQTKANLGYATKRGGSATQG